MGKDGINAVCWVLGFRVGWTRMPCRNFLGVRFRGDSPKPFHGHEGAPGPAKATPGLPNPTAAIEPWPTTYRWLMGSGSTTKSAQGRSHEQPPERWHFG